MALLAINFNHLNKTIILWVDINAISMISNLYVEITVIIVASLRQMLYLMVQSFCDTFIVVGSLFLL